MSAGNIKVEVISEKEIEVQYTKVGEWENGTLVLKEPFIKSGIEFQGLEKSMDIHGVIRKLEKMNYIPDGKVVTKEGSVEIHDLEDGVYLLEDGKKNEPSIQSALVTIPSWDADEGEMIYDITWNPKVQRMDFAAETGDDTQLICFLIICMISLLFVMRTLYFSLRLC